MPKNIATIAAATTATKPKQLQLTSRRIDGGKGGTADGTELRTQQKKEGQISRLVNVSIFTYLYLPGLLAFIISS